MEFIGLLKFIFMILYRRLLPMLYFYGCSFWMIVRLTATELCLKATKSPRRLLHALHYLFDYFKHKQEFLLRRLITLKRLLSDSLESFQSLLKSGFKVVKTSDESPTWGRLMLCYILTGVGSGEEEGSDGENPDRDDNTHGEAMSERQAEEPGKEHTSGSQTHDASGTEDSRHQALPPKKRKHATSDEVTLPKRRRSTTEERLLKDSQLERSVTDPKVEFPAVAPLVTDNIATEPLLDERMESMSTGREESAIRRETNIAEGLAARIFEYASNFPQESATPTETITALPEGLEERILAYEKQNMSRGSSSRNIRNCPPADSGDTGGQRVSRPNVLGVTLQGQVQTTVSESLQTIESAKDPFCKKVDKPTEGSDACALTDRLSASDIVKSDINSNFITTERNHPPLTSHDDPKIRRRKTNMFARSNSEPYQSPVIHRTAEPVPRQDPLPLESPASPTPMEDIVFLSELGRYEGSTNVNPIDEADRDLQRAIHESFLGSAARFGESQGEQQITHRNPGVFDYTPNEKTIGEVIDFDEDTIPYSEGDLAQANVPPEVDPQEGCSKSVEVERPYKRKRSRTYPGIARQPLEVKKDARYQKKFYGDKRPVTMPRKMGKGVKYGFVPQQYRNESDQLKYEGLSPEDKKLLDEWKSQNERYVHQHMPERNSDDSDDSPPPVVRHGKVHSSGKLPSAGSKMETSSYAASSSMVESPSSTESEPPKSRQKRLRGESPSTSDEERKQQYQRQRREEPDFIHALEKIKKQNVFKPKLLATENSNRSIPKCHSADSRDTGEQEKSFEHAPLSKNEPEKLTTTPEVVRISTPVQKSACTPTHRSSPEVDPKIQEHATLRYKNDFPQTSATEYQAVGAHENPSSSMPYEEYEVMENPCRTDSAEPSLRDQNVTDDSTQKAELKDETTQGKIVKRSDGSSIQEETCLSATEKEIGELCHVLQSSMTSSDFSSKETSCSSSASEETEVYSPSDSMDISEL